nr:H-NS family nucleoid-associated regulatory protein [Pseudomonas savastanoi]
MTKFTLAYDFFRFLYSPHFEPKARKKSRTSTQKREPKYVFVEDGVTKYWAGVGRKPRPIAQAIENGASLSDFLIKAEEQQRLDV